MVRKLSLKNADGDLYELNNLDSFAHLPQGLGVSFNNSYAGSGANFKSAGIELNQNIITFDMIFGYFNKEEAYRDYRKFAMFLNKQPYTLIYETEAGKYERDCFLSSFSKTEINQYNIIEEELQLETVTPWYEIIDETFDEYIIAPNGGKIYDFRSRNYTYDRTSNSSSKRFIIKNDSEYFGTDTSSPVEIQIVGACRNPYWQVYQNGLLVQDDGFNVITSSLDTLVVSSFPQDTKARIITSGSSDGYSVFQSQDFSRSNFVKIPLGTSELAFFNLYTAKPKIKLRLERLLV